MRCLQVSNTLLNPPNGDISQRHAKALYSGVRDGYAKGRHFWEPPQWIARIMGSMPSATFYPVVDLHKAAEEIRESQEACAISIMDCNRPFYRKLLRMLPETAFHIGGYGDLSEFAGPRRYLYRGMEEFLGTERVKMDYRFITEPMIPRLTLSDGCKHRCAFCCVDHTLKEYSFWSIANQVTALAVMNPKLVYISDKTFGQAKNYHMLVAASVMLKRLAPAFLGFIVQTTAAQALKIPWKFFTDAHIRYVELGIESVNDSVLKQMRKPHDVAKIIKAMHYLSEAGVNIIPNLIVGHPAETLDTYNATADFLREWRQWISHCNINSLVPYEGTSFAKAVRDTSAVVQSQNVPEKPWQKDPAPHTWAWTALHNLSLARLCYPVQYEYHW